MSLSLTVVQSHTVSLYLSASDDIYICVWVYCVNAVGTVFVCMFTCLSVNTLHAGDQQEQYVGRSTARGIPTDVWQSCVYWPDLSATMLVEWHFSGIKYLLEI